MRAVVQRVLHSEVRVGGEVIGRIGRGLLVLVGVGSSDTPESARLLAEKVAHLRVFEDEESKMNRSLVDIGLSALVVSQFTLYGDCRKGRRPSFDRAAPPNLARSLYESFVAALRELLRPAGGCVETGQFQAMMDVELVNDGPVTLLLDSEKTF